MRWKLVAARGLVAGLLLTASVPPFGWWVLGLAGAALLADTLLRVEGWRMRLLAAAATGLTLYAVGWFWMSEFSMPGYVLSVLGEAAFLAAASVTVARGRLWAVPAALVLAEYVRDHFPFGGVPLAGLPLGQVGGPLAPAARLGGQLLVVALIGGVAVAVVAALGKRFVYAAIALALVLVAVVGGHLSGGTHRTGTLSVSAVQGGGRRGLRAIYGDPTQVFLAQLRASTNVQPPVDLVVWPEDVIDVDQVKGSPQADAVARVARDLHATVVAGIVEDAGPVHFANAALAWDPDGTITARYDKVHRVPYGEYIPFRGLVKHFANLDAVPRDARAGHGPGVLHTDAGPLGVAISYEVFFADRARIAVRHGAQVMLVPTNASSFSTGQVPAQELAAARLRAMETGRWVVQSAPTGYSAVVDPGGTVLAHSDLGHEDVIQRTVERRAGQTPATRLGDGLPALAALVAAALAVALPKRREKLSV
ncbi:MAG: apolipoprotein N-acyltransferase [Actinobacteria bacterium]|nr:MAG: apolipoprotein N-acyltransferase [Actinomycetota bacterium]